MEDLSGMMTMTSDLGELSRCGFTTRFAGADIEMLKIGCARDTIEQEEFEKFWKLCFQLMRSFIVTCAGYTDGFPCMLAALLHKNASVVSARLGRFQKLMEAYHWAATKTGDTITTVIKRSPMQTTSVQYAAKFAESSKYKEPAILSASCFLFLAFNIRKRRWRFYQHAPLAVLLLLFDGYASERATPPQKYDGRLILHIKLPYFCMCCKCKRSKSGERK
jgi:hypothetical protein